MLWAMGYVIDAVAWRVEGSSFALSYWGCVGLLTAFLLHYTNTGLYRRGVLAFLLPLIFVIGGVLVPSGGLHGVFLAWASWVVAAMFSAVLLSCYVRFPPRYQWRAFFGTVIGAGVIAGSAGIALLWVPVGTIETIMFAV